METNDFHSASKRRLRLKPLPLFDLPPHPLLTPHQTTNSPPLQPFITEVLSEAISFSDSIIPTQFKSKGSPKSSEPSAAKVQLLTCDDIVQAGVKGEKTEPWFARHSVHENVAKNGTATYEEMVNGLMREHSVHEMEYTPDVYDAHKVLDWKEDITRLQTEGGLQSYRELAMEVYEMCHHIPFPLDNRTFSVLVVRALDSADSFIVAQIPIELSSVPQALYANGRNKHEGGSKQKSAAVQPGHYVSIERVKRTEKDGKNMSSWHMATSSDAGGNLPMSVQKMGVPGAVIKDVGFFMKWLAEKRE